MENLIYLSLPILFLIVIIYSIKCWRSNYLSYRRYANKFRLYEVRDSFVLLVAEKKINESDELFSKYYRIINDIISHQESFTFSSIIRSISIQKNEKQSDLFPKDLQGILSKSDPEVARAVFSFYESIVSIIIENSISLRILIKVEKFVAPIVEVYIFFWKTLSKIFQNYSKLHLDTLNIYHSSELVLGK